MKKLLSRFPINDPVNLAEQYISKYPFNWTIEESYASIINVTLFKYTDPLLSYSYYFMNDEL